MRIKRVLQGTALTALAAAAWMGAGSTDASAAISTDDISYFGGMSFNIDVPNDALEVMVGTAKVDKSGKAKVSAWDVYETSGDIITVDLSKVNVTKEAYFAVKTDKDEIPVFVKIDAASKKNKATLNAGTREITLEADGTKVVVDYARGTDIEAIEYSDNGTKMFVNEQLQYQGATLYMHVPGTEYTSETATKRESKDIKDYTDDKKDGKATKVVVVGKFPSKEVKLNVPKQANGPAIPVDYVKGTVKIKKGVELRVVGNSVSAPTSNAAFVDKTVSVGDFFKEDGMFKNYLEDKGTLEVRVAAKTENKGKVASKWTRVAIEKPKDVEFSIPTAAVSTKSAVTATVSGASIDLQYTADKKGAANGGLKISNKGTIYSIDCVVSATAPIPDAKGVVKGSKTIKAGKDVTIKGLSTDNKIWVRVSGDKTKKLWATNWLELHKVKLP